MVHGPGPAPALRKTEMQQANQFFYVVFVKSSINGWTVIYRLGNARLRAVRLPRVSHEAAQKAVSKYLSGSRLLGKF